MNLRSESVLFYAFRYALENNDSSVHTVVLELLSNKGELSKGTKKCIANEIREMKKHNKPMSSEWNVILNEFAG